VKNQIKLKKFMEELAHLEAQGACESMGLDEHSKDYEKTYQRVFHNFCVEAIEHSMTPGIYKNNPTTPVISKSIVEKFNLTGGYVANHLKDKKDITQDEIRFVTSQVRGAVNSLVNLVLYVQLGLRSEDFYYPKKPDTTNLAELEKHKKRMIEVETNRYFRILVFVFLVKWTDGLISSPSLSKNNIEKLLSQMMPEGVGNNYEKLKSSDVKNKFVANASKTVDEILKLIESRQKV